MEKTCENCKYDYRNEDEQPCCKCIHNATERFEPKETADTKPIVHGKWKHHENGIAYCSECGVDTVEDGTNYCPNCGAKMDGGDKE